MKKIDIIKSSEEFCAFLKSSSVLYFATSSRFFAIITSTLFSPNISKIETLTSLEKTGILFSLKLILLYSFSIIDIVSPIISITQNNLNKNFVKDFIKNFVPTISIKQLKKLKCYAPNHGYLWMVCEHNLVENLKGDDAMTAYDNVDKTGVSISIYPSSSTTILVNLELPST